MADIIIRDGVVITMDPQRRVIENGAVAIEADRIVDVDSAAAVVARHSAAKVISAKNMAVLPGLIDSHAHAGHGLVKTLGSSQPEIWNEMYGRIYTQATGPGYWYAEALLSALERLKCGTTCGVSYLGGGSNFARTDDPIYGEKHCQAVQKVGIRNILAVGPGAPPFPLKFRHWINGSYQEREISFADQLETCTTLIESWKKDPKIQICLSSPTLKPGLDDQNEHEELRGQIQKVRDLSRNYGVLMTQDGHTRGTIAIAHQQLDLLGPDVFLSHCTDLSQQEVDICRETQVRVVHNPSAVYSIRGRCPVPELLDAGVTVIMGSDGTAPDRSYDMFRHMFHCMHYHRTHFRDPAVLPPGKVLEMVTIDAARGLGMEEDLGSLEAGKKADVILLDLYKPHLYPLNMPVFRTVYFANGADVDTVIVDGQILMEKRKVHTVNETEVLELAQGETELMLERTGYSSLLERPERFWGHSRL